MRKNFEAPKFLTNFIEKILNCGRGVNLLRICDFFQTEQKIETNEIFWKPDGFLDDFWVVKNSPWTSRVIKDFSDFDNEKIEKLCGNLQSDMEPALQKFFHNRFDDQYVILF